MTGEVARSIEAQLARHRLQRIADGYRLVVGDAEDACWDRAEHLLRESNDILGWTDLRYLPCDQGQRASGLLGIAEVETEFADKRVPVFTAYGIEALNAVSVHGAFYVADGRLRLRAQYSLYADDPAVYLATRFILNAFGEQLFFGLGIAQGAVSAESLAAQRTRMDVPRAWRTHTSAGHFKEAAARFRRAGYVATSGQSSFCLEVPLEGAAITQMADPEATTALLTVSTEVPHPVAGAGYLATLVLPLHLTPDRSVEACQRLNALEMMHHHFVPRLGSWGLRGLDDELVYTTFVPAAEPLEGLEVTLMNWNVLRARNVKDTYWSELVEMTLTDAAPGVPE